MVTHNTLVAAVRMNKEIVVRTDNRAQVRCGGTVDIAVFAEHIVITHFQRRRLTGILQILSLRADGAEREELVPLAELRRATDYHMTVQHTAGAQLHMRSHHTIRPNLHVICNFASRVNNSCRMNICHIPHSTPRSAWLQAQNGVFLPKTDQNFAGNTLAPAAGL